MGCYGIGVTRIVAAAIEQNHDERGIVFPRADRALRGLRWCRSASTRAPAVREAAEKLYAELLAAGIDVLLDDRDERPGVMFADMELHRHPAPAGGLASAASQPARSSTRAARDRQRENAAARRGALPFLRDKLAAA